MQAQAQRHKGIDYIELNLNKESGYDLVLLHGFGADMQDLAGLLHYMESANIKRAIFPNGIQPANGVPYGRAWFPIDVAALEQAMMTASFRDMSQNYPNGMDECTDKISDFLTDIIPDFSNAIIGGFSQGAMLSTNIMLQGKLKFKGLIILSGTLLCLDNWRNLAAQKENFPFFQSHGVNDALLNPKDADRLFKLLSLAENQGEFHSFQGGHEIPLEIIEKMVHFINKL